MDPALVALGFGLDLESAVPEGTEPARVVRVDRGMVRALGRTSEVRLWLGQLRPLPVPPTTGDWVVAAPGASEVLDVLPRRTVLQRAASDDAGVPQVLAANVDVVGICADLSVGLQLRRLERFMAMAFASGATPLLLLTKPDVVAAGGTKAAGSLARALEQAASVAPGVEVLPVSGHTGEGVDRLRAVLDGRFTLVLVGPSGVGKSTLVNALAGHEVMATAAVRRGDGKGRHTTTTRELIPLPDGGVVLDTPGLRSLVPWTGPDDLSRAFPDVASLAEGCRFGDCAHDVEPGCAVAAAVTSGVLDADRLAGWRRLRDDLLKLPDAASRRGAGGGGVQE